MTKCSNLGDNEKEDKREPDSNTPLSEIVPTEEEMISAAVDFLKTAPPQNTKRALKEIGPEAIKALFRIAVEESGAALSAEHPSPPPSSLPSDAPPLWAERTTGREVSPVDWIKKFYGNKNPDNWDPMGMNRDLLVELDQPLSRAYATMISRDKVSALPGLPSKDVVRIDDPAAALARKKQQVKEASARYREKVRNAI